MSDSEVTRRHAIGSILHAAVLAHPIGSRLLVMSSPSLARGPHTELQPLLAEVRRLIEAMAYLGEPFSEVERAGLDAAANITEEARAVAEIQRILDPHCLLAVRINPESRVAVERGAAPAHLVEQGWRAFLMKVRNEAGATSALDVESEAAVWQTIASLRGRTTVVAISHHTGLGNVADLVYRIADGRAERVAPAVAREAVA